ncbi:unnamed protein product [Sphenostylis stenocarpa]|uniref:Uncharacterized protein n=1 Tax=Sphenostylis stenocarpa TaxID=92480 RepID=A0AA86W2U4_9FABA|nr:unnamed protein product [Sphenostylis stenocarpa]
MKHQVRDFESYLQAYHRQIQIQIHREFRHCEGKVFYRIDSMRVNINKLIGGNSLIYSVCGHKLL